MMRAVLVASLLLAPALGNAEKAPETVCELMASLAPQWLESHRAGLSLEQITADTMASFDRAGLTADSDRGSIFRTAASISLVGLGQLDPKTPQEAADVALEYCAIWYRSRGRRAYEIPDRPMRWD